MIKQVEPNKLKPTDFILDVRQNAEHDEISLAQEHWLQPLDKLNAAAFIAEHHLDGGQTLNIICRSGKRAGVAAEEFIKAGFKNVAVVKGGFERAEQQGVQMIKAEHLSIERQIKIAAGGLVVLGVLLGFFINPWFYLLSLAIGVGLISAGVTGFCGLGEFLMRMPWNK